MLPVEKFLRNIGMPISSVGSGVPNTYILPSSQQPAASTQAATPNQAAVTTQATPAANQSSGGKADTDTDAPATSAASATQATQTASATKSAAAGGDMFKINADGTVGRLHVPRHPKSAGVVHA